ncbi:hypothetical protein DSO57_1033293 [Entomophthora muscae]|uniref:Uncharacterized protein n=1 Tax=Entomophthora muscae TaxID=34485 RepID=A0ACC2RR19_9FUNG|nr:hypothetical protein DSO57_1033293 [Entomophthora muscae]
MARSVMASRNRSSMWRNSLKNALDLKKKIYTKVYVFPIPREERPYDLLAVAVPQYDPIEKARGRLVPKALCKQIDTCSNDDQVDFTVYVNQNQPFYFASDFKKNEVGYSAIDTLSHEFLHGMGFSDCLRSGTCNANVVPFFEKKHWTLREHRRDQILF